MKKFLVLLVIASLCVAGVAGMAVAKGKKGIGSRVDINYQPGTYSDSFFGKVRSKKDACEKNRTVKVKRQAQGDDVTVGSDQTDNDGDYSVNLGDYAENGKYYAKAKKKRTQREEVLQGRGVRQGYRQLTRREHPLERGPSWASLSLGALYS